MLLCSYQFYDNDSCNRGIFLFFESIIENEREGQEGVAEQVEGNQQYRQKTEVFGESAQRVQVQPIT